MSEVITEILEITEETHVIEILEMGFAGPQGIQGIPGTAAPPVNIAYGDAPGVVQSFAANTLITNVAVHVRTVFNGSTASSVSVGTLALPNLFQTTLYVDLSEVGIYTIPLDEIVLAGTDIRYAFNLGIGCTQGTAVILLNYVPLV
jgi:hypothetical protein